MFDCCHSGTATRAVEVDDELDRKVEFADLVGGDEAARAAAIKTYGDTVASASRGIDGNGHRKPAFNLTPTSGEPVTKGKLVAFYAAQTVETTPEMPLPKGTADAPRFGLFTFTILSKLAENPDVTYRQLGQAVLQQYSADSRTRPTPLFEGELDARVFGTDKTDAVMQWPIVVRDGEASIGAGLLHRLAPGSKLAILPSALSSLSDAVGYLEVESAKNLESRVKPVEFDRARAQSGRHPCQCLCTAGRNRRRLQARPRAARRDEGTGEGKSTRQFGSRRTGRGQGDRLYHRTGRSGQERGTALRGDARECHCRRRQERDRQAGPMVPAGLGRRDLEGWRQAAADHNPSRRSQEAGRCDDHEFAHHLPGHRLSRLAAASDYKPEDVDVQFQVKRRGGDGLEPLQASVVPRVSPGDEVHVLAKNCSDHLVDINVLYVGSDYSITHIVAERLAPQATLEIGADILLQRYDAEIPRDHRHRLGQDAGRHPFQPR